MRAKRENDQIRKGCGRDQKNHICGERKNNKK